MRRKQNPYPLVVVALVLLMFTPKCMNGQALRKGFFGGINISQVSGDPYQGFNKLGFNAGFFINSLIESNFYWQAEVKFASRGVYKGPSENDETLYKSSYYYLELPLSVHYLFSGRIILELGTSPEVLITAKYYDENGLLDESFYPDNRRFGLSVFAGLGYQFNNRILADLRYTNSAIPFRDPEEWNNYLNRGFFHNVISLSMVYSLKTK